MVIETEIVPFLNWFLLAGPIWLIVVACIAAFAALVGLLVSAVEHGPVAAVGKTWRVMVGGTADVLKTSPRRVWALTRLAMKESVRPGVIAVVFAVFVVVLAFAGLLLDPGSPNPGRLYLSFVLTATSYLVLLLALFLSSFSLAMDIRKRTLHTVVTKPVRSTEVVLGRMLGFTIIGTGLLAIMALVSFGFVVQGLRHDHPLTVEDLSAVRLGAIGVEGFREGSTQSERGHRHRVLVDASGEGRTDVAQGHWHEVTVTGSGAEARCEVGGPQGMLVARVPVYGKIRFRDRDGLDAPEGISVGDEWTYRGYIQGGSPAALIWTFDDVSERKFPGGLPMELMLGVFRTHKGNIERGVYGSIAIRNPENGLTVETGVFESKEFGTNSLLIPREITRFASAQVVPQRIETPQGVELKPAQLDPGLAQKRRFDLYEDLVADGKVEIWVQCIEPGQYFGAARADLYLRAADAPFWINFIKGYVGIWLQMVLVIGFGVMFSTFLSGAVAMIATLGVLVMGHFKEYLLQLAYGELPGGGVVEAAYRTFKQENLLSELDAGAWLTPVMQMTDSVMQGALWVVSWFLPSFGKFSYANYVANGFDISLELLLMYLVVALGFLVPLFVAAHFFLKTREVAR